MSKNSPKTTKWQLVLDRLPFLRNLKLKQKFELPVGFQKRLVIELKPARKKRPTKKQLQAMRKRQIATAIVCIVVGLSGIVFFAQRPVQETPPPVQTSSYAPPTPKTAQPDIPSRKKELANRLRIPDIGVDAPITTIGKQSNGSIEVPADYASVGWYRLGPQPGSIGPAVIVGHVDSTTGPAVFWRLNELTPGQRIEVVRENGTVLTFIVHSIRQFEQDNFPTEEVYGNIDHAGLRLITCSGTFNRNTERYSHNTVVFATLVQ